jgi:hypothetical protein
VIQSNQEGGNMDELRYYLGKTFKGEVFAVYRAFFDKDKLLKEFKWQVPDGKQWENTKSVSEWYFIGDDLTYPSTENEVKKYLPADAINRA